MCVVEKVLVVEDEEDVAELVQDVLELEGIQVRLAAGESALDEALAFHPDVVLLDLMMPGVDGFEVARRFRAHVQTTALPIVVMTAMHDPAARAAEVGTQHFLAKPFDISVLLATVERAAGTQ